MPSSNVQWSKVLALGALVAITALVLFLLLSSGSSGHRLETTVSDARYMVAGSQIRAAGQVVGKVVDAHPTRAGRAHLVLEIDDNRVWPLPRGTKLRWRWNGTITYAGRYIELDLPRHATHGTYQDGARIPAADVTTTVEADDLLRVFDHRSRRDLKALLGQGGPALIQASPGLRRALGTAPPALDQANAVLDDLGGDERSLDTLVRSGDAVVHAIRAARPGIGPLVENAAITFAAVAAKADALRRTLAETPAALVSARRTLRHADSTLRDAGRLTQRLAPGVTQVRLAIPPLQRLLRTLYGVAPDAIATLRTARRATPTLNPLLVRARQLMPEITSIGRQGARQLACVRPYTPEAAGLASTWDRFLLNTDKQGKYARGNYPPMPFDQTRMSSAQVTHTFPGLQFAFPMPPGYLAGQPWFLPQCDMGPDTLDVNKDPEIGRGEPGS